MIFKNMKILDNKKYFTVESCNNQKMQDFHSNVILIRDEVRRFVVWEPLNNTMNDI